MRHRVHERDSDAPTRAARLPDPTNPSRPIGRLEKANGRGRAVGPVPTARWSSRDMLCETRLGPDSLARHGLNRWGRYRLASDSVEALRTVGTFGTVEVGDLRALYSSKARAKRELLRLKKEGLLHVEIFQRGHRVIEAASLTHNGKRLLERVVDPRDPGDEHAQRYRSGPARSAQVPHDTAIYRAAQLEIASIETADGRILRVQSDGDLQRLARRRIERALRNGASPEAAQASTADRLGLTVKEGSLIFPDARIEYEMPARDEGLPGTEYVDVEVSTPDYRGPALRAKAAAGFRIYHLDKDGGLRRFEPDVLR